MKISASSSDDAHCGCLCDQRPDACRCARRWGAGLYYNRGQFTSAVYLENLFDLQYAASSINMNQIFRGAPFNARATVGWLF